MVILIPGTVYSFETLAPSILGDKFKNVKVLSSSLCEEIPIHEGVVATYRNIFPLLQSSTAPQNPDGTTFHKVRSIDSGEVTWVSPYWISEATLATSVTCVLNIAIVVSNPSVDEPNLRRLLTTNGYSNFSMTKV